jgi:hypothetical protein
MHALLAGNTCTTNRASYDLIRLRLKGLITRLPGRNVYRITPAGQRFAVFYTKLHNRLLRPLMAADPPPAPLPLRQACTPSTDISMTTSTKHASVQLEQHFAQVSNPSDQGSLAAYRPIGTVTVRR